MAHQESVDARGSTLPALDSDTLSVAGTLSVEETRPGDDADAAFGETAPGSRSAAGAWPQGDDGPTLVGASLGRRYRVKQLLGRGGMGEVYRATDQVLGKDVALKLVREVAGGSDGMRRLREEVLLAQRVTHRNEWFSTLKPSSRARPEMCHTGRTVSRSTKWGWPTTGAILTGRGSRRW